MTTSQTAAATGLPESPPSAWTLANEHIDRMSQIKAMMLAIVEQMQAMTYDEADPNTPYAQQASTLLCITHDLVDQARASADAVFNAIVRGRS
jgi:hypothetical protein